MTTEQLSTIFFSDLKSYNSTNFNHIKNADVRKDVANPVVLKSFSAVITRYMIFIEKHPEISREENNILYYKLKLDLVANFFMQYPELNPDYLVGFQLELRKFVKEHRIEMCKPKAERESA
jgi:hypothetical protein